MSQVISIRSQKKCPSASVGLRVGVDDIPVTGIPVTSKAIGPDNRPYVVNTFSNTSNAILLSGGAEIS